VTSVVGPPGKGLLRRDDLILAVDGQPFTRANVFRWQQQAGRKMLARGPLPLTLLRGRDTLTLTIPPLELAAWQRVRFTCFPLITVIAAPLVATLLVWRRPDLTAAWVVPAVRRARGIGHGVAMFRFPQTELTGPLGTYVGVSTPSCCGCPRASCTS